MGDRLRRESNGQIHRNLSGGIGRSNILCRRHLPDSSRLLSVRALQSHARFCDVADYSRIANRRSNWPRSIARHPSFFADIRASSGSAQRSRWGNRCHARYAHGRSRVHFACNCTGRCRVDRRRSFSSNLHPRRTAAAQLALAADAAHACCSAPPRLAGGWRGRRLHKNDPPAVSIR